MIMSKQSRAGCWGCLRVARGVGTVLVLLICRQSISAEVAAHWSQFHGPNGSGIASGDTAGPIEFGPKKNLLWNTKLPAGHSSPCVAGNRVFVTAYDVDDEKSLRTICLDAATGDIRWSKTAPAGQIEKHHEVSNPATATPATDGKIVVSYFGSAGLFAYDFDGNEVWTKPLPMAKTSREFGSGTSPIVADGKAILDVHLDNDSYLAAYDLGSGDEVWRAPRGLFNRGWATPVTWREGEAGRVGMAAEGRFIAYDLQSGKEVWWVAGVGNQVCATPVVAGDVIVISSAGVLGDVTNVIAPPTFDDALAKFDANQDGSIALSEIPDTVLMVDRKASDGAGNMTLAEAFQLFGQSSDKPVGRLDWEKLRLGVAAFNLSDMNKTNVMAVRTGGDGDVTKSNVLWQQTRGVPEVPSPLVYRDRVWMIRNGGLLTCLDLADGQIKFQKRVGEGGGYYASPVAGDGRIYVASDSGVVAVIQAGDKFRVLARNQINEPILATPALVDGTLYVRTTKQLLAFR